MSAVGFLKARWLELNCAAKKKAFYCRALSGESNYNLSINADATVSCNCLDKEDESILGSMRKSLFVDIYKGEKATRIRNTLAAGSLPLKWCASCCDLRITSKRDALKRVTQYGLPKLGMMLENTRKCNLKCLSCGRADSKCGQEMNDHEWELACEQIGKLNIDIISLLKLGEPFMHSRINEQVATLRKHNPKSRILCSTNGIPLTIAKHKAALNMDMIIISIDGVNNEMVSMYQRGGNFDRPFANMRDLVKARDKSGSNLAIVWRYVLFNWNDSKRAIDAAIKLSSDVKVDAIQFLPTNTPWHGKSIRYMFNESITNNKTIMGGYMKNIASQRVDNWKEMNNG